MTAQHEGLKVCLLGPRQDNSKGPPSMMFMNICKICLIALPKSELVSCFFHLVLSNCKHIILYKCFKHNSVKLVSEYTFENVSKRWQIFLPGDWARSVFVFVRKAMQLPPWGIWAETSGSWNVTAPLTECFRGTAWPPQSLWVLAEHQAPMISHGECQIEFSADWDIQTGAKWFQLSCAEPRKKILLAGNPDDLARSLQHLREGGTGWLFR